MEEKKQKKQLLHYGCLIYLTYKDESGNEYYVVAEGYTKNKIQLKKQEEILKSSSIMACLFKVYPTFYNNEYIKSRKKYDERRKFKKVTNIEKRNAKAEIPKAIKAMEEETTLNHEQYEKYKSSHVVFGQTIQLLHLNSNKYLFYDLNHVSEFESNNLKVGLKDEHSDETCYRILPCYTFQQEGSGNIYEEDIVYIVSTVDQMKKAGGEPFIHASRIKRYEDYNGAVKEKREVNISTDKKTPWKIHIFSEYIDERDGFLQVSDSVWINYSEQNLSLIVQKPQINQVQTQNKKMIQKQDEDEAEQKINYIIKFEGCPDSANYNKFIGNSNGVFTIESQSITKGGLVRWNTYQNPAMYRLRNLTTMQYLSVNPITNNDQEELQFSISTEADYSKASLFKFELIYSTLTSYNREKAQEYLQKDCYFRLSTNILLDQEESTPTSKISKGNNNREVWLKTGQGYIGSDPNPQPLPCFTEMKKEEFVFKMAKTYINEVRMTNFLLSCLKTIKRAEQYLNPNFINNYTIQDERFQLKYKNFLVHVARLERCLKDLNLFCHNKLIAHLYLDQVHGEINVFIQNVLREQQFIEVLVKILCMSFPNQQTLDDLEKIQQQENEMKNDDQKKKKTQVLYQIRKEFFFHKKKICQLIYKLLTSICEKNQTNQTKAFTFLPIFGYQSMYIIEALNCIIEIVKRNEELLMQLPKQVLDEKDTGKGNTRNAKKNQPQRDFQMGGTKSDLSDEDYASYYNKICISVLDQHNFHIKIRFDMIMFYCKLLKKKSQSAQNKRLIIHFLQFISQYRGKGLNINQERIYKSLMSQGHPEELYKNEVLIKIEAQGDIMKVFFQGEEMVFVEFFTKSEAVKHKNQKQANNIELGQSKYHSMFLKKQEITTPSSLIATDVILSLISEQLMFYCSMCNSRNYTWKRFVETFLPWEVLMVNIVESVIGYDMRAIICKLLNKLYIDQEPRRQQRYPELCKIVNTHEKSKKAELTDYNVVHHHTQGYEQLDFDVLSRKMFQFIKEKKELVSELCEQYNMKDPDSTKLETLRRIFKEQETVYNNLTLEIIKVIKIQIDFGVYQLKVGTDESETMKINQEYFDLLIALFFILEFDPTYPEGRKILVEKRKEKKSNQPKLFGAFGKGLAMLNVFAIMDDDKDEKDKKKKNKPSEQVEQSPINLTESFLKQATVLKKILSKFLHDSHSPDLYIKLEICDILNRYLDQKMEFCLNVFKMKFKEYIYKLQFIEKLETGELNLENDQKYFQDQFKKVITDCIKALIPPIMRTGTPVDETDPNFATEDFGFGFGNIANLAIGGVSPETENKDIEAIDINRILGFEVFPPLISLFCMTQSIQMETKILNLLTRFYNQRFEFAELTTKMLLLFDTTNIKVFQELKKRIRKLAKNIDESENWMSDLYQPNNKVVLKETIGYFNQFNQLLYADSMLDDQQHVQVVQTEKVDVVRQDIMRNLQIHDLGITLIRNGIYMLDQMPENEPKRGLQELFRSCFKFLKNFLVENTVNQFELADQLSVFLVNFESDLGQVDLINEIFRNNKKICLEKTSLIIDDFLHLIMSNGRQVKYMEFFLIIQKVKNEYIQSNQKAVLNILLDPRFKSHIFWMKERVPVHHHEKNPMAQMIKHEFDFEALVKPENPKYSDEPFNYHAKLLEILYNCTIGKEGLLNNETRLRGIIQLRYVFEMLSAEDTFLPNMKALSGMQGIQSEKAQYSPKVTMLKVPLLNYVFFTYLESEKISDDIFKCIPDVQALFEFETERILEQQQAPTPEYVDYFYNHFVFTMNSLLKIYQKEMREQNSVHQNQQLVLQQLEQLTQAHSELKNALKQLAKQDFLLTDKQKGMLNYFLCDDILKEEQKEQQEKEEQERERQRKAEEETQRLLLLQKKKKKKGLSGLTLDFSFKKQKQPVRPLNFNPDKAWKELWTIFLTQFLNSKELKQEIESEHLVFAKALDKAEELYSKDNLMKEYINKNEIFKKLIEFLKKGYGLSGTVPTLKQVLRALRNYIVISQDNVDQKAEEDEKDHLIQEEKQKHQNFLNQNNAMQVILLLLSDYSNPHVSDALYNDLVMFGINLLDGGNRDVQRSVYSFFLNYTSSEVFFMRLHLKFDQEIVNIKKEDEDDGIVSYVFQNLSDEIENTLRFLQLFAEGHYAELQNYIRFQKMNYHSFDLFSSVVELLAGYMQVRKKDYFLCMIQCFDTITEYVQGPCLDNQIALFQANFLDMSSNLFSVDEIMDEIDQQIIKRNLKNSTQSMDVISSDTGVVKKQVQPLPRWMYSRLKYKCSITLLSLLEARKSNEKVITIIKSLNVDILKRNIVDIFYMFQTQYKEEYSNDLFLHFNIDPDNNSSEQELNRASFIMETGFNLFILFSIFLESRDVEDSVKQEEQEEDDSLQKFLKESILGQIMSLFISILQSIKDTMVEMSNQAQNMLLGGNDQEVNYEQMKENLKKRRQFLFKKSMDFFKEKSAHIEVLREDKMLEKTYFYMPPFCFSLDKETKIKFNQDANRISVKAKVSSLLQQSDELIKKMKLNYQLQLYLNKIPVLAVLVSKIQLIRDIGFLLAIAINGMVLIVYEKKESKRQTELKQVIITLGTIVIVSSMMIVAYFLAKTAPLIIKKAWVGVQKDNYNMIKILRRFILTFIYLLSDFYVIYYLVYGATAVIGTIYSPFFFAFHLFDVLVRYPVLLNVVKAVWIPKKAIMFTLFLFIVLMYVFSLFAYYWLYESYEPGYCDSTYQCLLTAIDRSFKNDGGIGGFLTPSSQVEGREDDNVYFLIRFLFDNLYFILLMIIMINIVSGIIIDTFGTLREDLNKFNFDLENFCFICGFDKETIEKASKNQRGFQYHIKEEHYLWNYLFYIAYIKNKDQTELSGIESYVAEKIDEDDISWFPTFKALCMKDDSQEDEQQVMNTLAKISEEQDHLKNMITSVNQQLINLEDELNG